MKKDERRLREAYPDLLDGVDDPDLLRLMADLDAACSAPPGRYVPRQGFMREHGIAPTTPSGLKRPPQAQPRRSPARRVWDRSLSAAGLAAFATIVAVIAVGLSALLPLMNGDGGIGGSGDAPIPSAIKLRRGAGRPAETLTAGSRGFDEIAAAAGEVVREAVAGGRSLDRETARTLGQALATAPAAVELSYPPPGLRVTDDLAYESVTIAVDTPSEPAYIYLDGKRAPHAVESGPTDAQARLLGLIGMAAGRAPTPPRAVTPQVGPVIVAAPDASPDQATVQRFLNAVVTGDEAAARALMSPEYSARVPDLRRALGIPGPWREVYMPGAEGTDEGGVSTFTQTAVFVYSDREITARITVTNSGGKWQVTRIERGEQPLPSLQPTPVDGVRPEPTPPAPTPTPARDGVIHHRGHRDHGAAGGVGGQW